MAGWSLSCAIKSHFIGLRRVSRVVLSQGRKAGSSGRYRSPCLNYAFHYGMYRFYRKHYSAEHSPFVNAAVYAGIVVKLTVSSIRSRKDARGPT